MNAHRHPRPRALTPEDYLRRIDAGEGLKSLAAFALFFGLGALIALIYWSAP